MVIVAAGLLAGLPMMLRGFWPALHDARFHAVWYTNFSGQFWQGDWYPRWLMDLNGGLGSPAFYYYPPVPYFFTSLLRPLFGGDAAGWHQLGAGAVLALVVSGLGMWWWLRRLVAPVPALAGALAYLLAPYHLAADLYVRGAYAELWSFAWLPLVFLGIDCGRAGQRRGLLLLAASYGLLVATHLPTTLLFSLLPPAYAWFTSEKPARWRRLCWTGLGMAWGVGLAAAYVVPAMTMQGHVSMSALTQSPNLQFGNNFLVTALHPEADGFRADLFWQAVLTLSVGIGGFLLAGCGGGASARRQAVFWLGALYFFLFLMLPLSAPLWEHIPKLHLVQFPWRALTLETLAACGLLALGLNAMTRPLELLERSVAGVLVLLLAGWLYLDARRILPFACAEPPLASELMARQSDASEYLPRWVKRPPAEVLAALEVNRNPAWAARFTDGALPLLPRCVVQDQARFAVVFTAGSGAVKLLAWEPRQIKMTVNAHEPARLQLSRFFIPGWEAMTGLQPLAVRPTEPDGLLELELPPRRHQLRLVLRREWPEKTGLGISAGALLAWLVVGISRIKANEKHA